MTDEDPLPAADPGEWYVAFYSDDRRAWWELLDPPGFKHCSAFSYSSHAERWLLYDVTRDRTFVRAYTVDGFSAYMNHTHQGATILRISAFPLVRRRWQRWGFFCTAAVKHLLGIPSRALRPRALFRDLLSMGAIYAFGTGPRDEDESSAGA